MKDNTDALRAALADYEATNPTLPRLNEVAEWEIRKLVARVREICPRYLAATDAKHRKDV